MPLVSATDWLNSQCADRLISAVLIGPSLAQVVTSYRPTNTTESHQRPHRSYKEPFTTYTHTYKTLYNAHAQQSTIGNTRSPVTIRSYLVVMIHTIETFVDLHEIILHATNNSFKVLHYITLT